MATPDPQPLMDVIQGALGPVISAVIGRIGKLAERAARGGEFSLSRWLLELPSAVGGGIMASGLADWLGASQTVACAIAATAGWIGPRVIVEVILARLKAGKGAAS
ncbi:phage holin family protein [Zavarzinia aquatilis]|nr:phage holin family protein [Zavarzinia aquatilis]